MHVVNNFADVDMLSFDSKCPSIVSTTAISVENRQFFPPLVLMHQLKGFPLEFGIGTLVIRN